MINEQEEIKELSSCDDGSLEGEKMEALQSEILGAVKKFTKFMSITKEEYYGAIANKARNKKRQKEMAER